MKKKECPSCAMEIDASARVCPICNYEFPMKSTGKRIVAIVLVILMLVYIFYLAIF